MNLATPKLFPDNKNGHIDELHELPRDPWHTRPCCLTLTNFETPLLRLRYKNIRVHFKSALLHALTREKPPHNFNDSLHDLQNGHIDDLLQDSSRLTLCRRHLDHFKTLLSWLRQSDPRFVDGCAHETHTESPPRCLSKSVAPPPRRFAPRPAVTERR